MIILSTIIGFISSAIPELMKFFQDKADKKHEIKLLEMQIEANKQQHIQRLAEIDMQADIADSKAAHTPAKPLAQKLADGERLGIHWLDGLNASVRPVITYLFFGVYVWVKAAQYQLLVAPKLPWQEPLTHAQALVALWTPDDMALFAAILTFWFGARTFLKMRGK